VARFFSEIHESKLLLERIEDIRVRLLETDDIHERLMAEGG
jgi:hypothetical protein